MTPGTGGLDMMSPVLGKFLYFVNLWQTYLACTLFCFEACIFSYIIPLQLRDVPNSLHL